MIIKVEFSGAPARIENAKFKNIEQLEEWICQGIANAENAAALVKREGSVIECFNLSNGRLFARYSRMMFGEKKP